MTGIFVSRAPAGRPKCKRCGRPFTATKEGQEYGLKCARMLAGQVQLDSQALVTGKVLTKGKKVDEPIYVKDKKGEVTAVII